MGHTAFVPAATLRRWVEALGERFGILFVALSYRWLGKDAPDGDGFHLGIVAAVARLYLEYLKKHVFERNGLGDEADFALFCGRAAAPTPAPRPHPHAHAAARRVRCRGLREPLPEAPHRGYGPAVWQRAEVK